MRDHTEPRSANGADPGLEIRIRPLDGADDGALIRLAGRDSADVPSAPLIGAIRAGDLIAARSLGSGEAIADPFVASADAARLLELRAAQLGFASAARAGPSSAPHR